MKQDTHRSFDDRSPLLPLTVAVLLSLLALGTAGSLLVLH